jgi:hypothetical protein
VDIKVQVDVLGNNTWRDYGTFTVPPGTAFTHIFPDGYSAYWVRLSSGTATTAGAQFTYGIAPGSAVKLDLKPNSLTILRVKAKLK